MANFTESATLVLRDKASKDINKVNASLRKLFATSQKMKKMNLGIDVKQLTKAQNKIKAITKDINRMQRGRQATVRVNTSQIDRAQRALTRMRQSAARPITQRIITHQTHGRGPGGGGGSGGSGPGGVVGMQRNISVLNASWVQLAATSLKLNAVFGAMAGIRAAVQEGAKATMSYENADVRLRMAGFDEGQITEFQKIAVEVQKKYTQVPAAEILNASVEQLTALTVAGKSTAEYQAAMERIAMTSQIMSNIYQDSAKGAEGARQAERLSQIMGEDIDDQTIRKIQEAAIRAIVASGNEMTMEEAVRSLQQLTPALARSMDMTALTDLLLTREEGGRASTATWRMAVYDLMRDSLDPGDKAAMAKLGLRRASGGADLDVVAEASANLVDITEARIMPILEKAGLATRDPTTGELKTGEGPGVASEITAWLDEFGGMSMSAARAFADAAVSLSSGETKRQRESAERVRPMDVLTTIADDTFGAAIRSFVSSFDTAVATNIAPMAPAFAEAIKPFNESMTKAGELGTEGKYSEAATEMLGAVAEMMSGTGGDVIKAMALTDAVSAIMTPTSTPLEKAAGVIQLAGVALLEAANIFMGKKGEVGSVGTIKDLFLFGPAAILPKVWRSIFGSGEANAAETPGAQDVFTPGAEYVQMKPIYEQRIAELTAQLAADKTAAEAALATITTSPANAGWPLEEAGVWDRNKQTATYDTYLKQLEATRAELDLVTAALASIEKAAAAAAAAKNPWDDMNKYKPDPQEKFVLDRSKVEKVGKITDKARKRQDDIKAIQKLKGLDETGVMDEKTVQAIKDFQKEYKLLIDGIIGRQTDSVLRQLQSFDYFGQNLDKQEGVPTPTDRPRSKEEDMRESIQLASELIYTRKQMEHYMTTQPDEKSAAGTQRVLDQQWSDNITTGSAAMKTAIEAGGVVAGTNVATGLKDGATSAGATIASSMTGAAATVGSIIAAAISNAASSITVGTASSSKVDTGAQAVAA